MNTLISSVLFSLNNEVRTKQLQEEQEKNRQLNVLSNKNGPDNKVEKINTHIHKKDKINSTINTKSQETRIRRIMEAYFKVSFNKIRPPWLKNKHTGRNLELDLYNQELNIAVEIQGEQHIHFLPHFHKSEAEFQAQRFRDAMKYKMCKENKVKLVIVYYYEITHNMLDTEVLDLVLSKLASL